MLKKVMVLLLALAMVVSLAACGEEKSSPEPSKDPVTSDAPKTDAPKTDAPATTEPSAPAEDVATAVDFESGAYDFAKVAYSYAACDLASTISVGDYNGSKALIVKSPKSDNTFSGSVPFVAIDIVALVGADNVSKVAKIGYEIGCDYGTNGFQAVSGICGVVNNGNETKNNWSVFLEEENPKTYVVDAKDLDASGATYLYFAINDSGNPIAPTDYDLCIDNIVLYDADGNALTVDETVKFAQVEGIDDSFWLNLDWSNGCKKPVDEVILVNKDGKSPSGLANGNWWPNNEQSWAWTADGAATYMDMTEHFLEPGMILTIYYETLPYADQEAWDAHAWAAPLLVCQSWTDGGQIQLQVPKHDDAPETNRFNESRTIVQFTYEEINQAFLDKGGFDPDGDGDVIKNADFFGVAGMGGDGNFNIFKVTIGKAE